MLHKRSISWHTKHRSMGRRPLGALSSMARDAVTMTVEGGDRHFQRAVDLGVKPYKLMNRTHFHIRLSTRNLSSKQWTSGARHTSARKQGEVQATLVEAFLCPHVRY